MKIIQQIGVLPDCAADPHCAFAFFSERCPFALDILLLLVERQSFGFLRVQLASESLDNKVRWRFGEQLSTWRQWRVSGQLQIAFAHRHESDTKPPFANFLQHEILVIAAAQSDRGG